MSEDIEELKKCNVQIFPERYIHTHTPTHTHTYVKHCTEQLQNLHYFEVHMEYL